MAHVLPWVNQFLKQWHFSLPIASLQGSRMEYFQPITLRHRGWVWERPWDAFHAFHVGHPNNQVSRAAPRPAQGAWPQGDCPGAILNCGWAGLFWYLSFRWSNKLVQPRGSHGPVCPHVDEPQSRSEPQSPIATASLPLDGQDCIGCTGCSRFLAALTLALKGGMWSLPQRHSSLSLPSSCSSMAE